MSEKIVLEVLGEEVSFTGDGHYDTDSQDMVNLIVKNFGKVVLTPEPIITCTHGWGIFYLISLIDPNFKIVSLEDIDVDEVEYIRNIVKNSLVF